ncbi:MAG: carboxypeptidase-like regulatory domain-containing protein, partial [Prevotellaceae bacterium]|nr:carboxypeptidase-like regulatory domain-containing protein [Prevotellaceae bacterium]
MNKFKNATFKVDKNKSGKNRRNLFCFCILFLFAAMNAMAQQQPVTGTVTDAADNEPLAGVSVAVKGTVTGTATAADGRFSLNVAPDAVLVFSYLGYQTKEVPVNGQSQINIALSEDARILDEVVVVGFGTQKKVNLTGAVGLATAKDIEARPVVNATQALQGLVPGLFITTNTGEMDKSMSINIRGTGTIGDGSSGSPLILIDGMEGDLNTVNPQDIENVSVLKDAAASSIYGSRAPFGVILITTKKGTAGKLSVNYNNSFRITNPIHLPQMMDSYSFANFFNAGYRNAGWGQFISDETMQRMLDFQAAGGTNTGGLLDDGNVWGKPAG